MNTNFFHHTQNWIKGEIFEGTIILICGIAVAFIGVSFWKFGTTPSAKSLLIPLLVVGGLFAVAGAGLRTSNAKRMVEFEQLHAQNEKSFIEAEKQRVESFQFTYQVSKIVAAVCFALTLVIFWATKNPSWQSVGIAVAILGLSGLIINYFSQERADIYYGFILENLSK